ncbi:MAG TPA: sulfur carrier protein ThiS [Candidatus Binataceae bacterium]|jgi:sulfur carrier protein|nr:sulfur carrier protein ThiS [Candidatus Binataceae bacterium]
MSTQALPPFQIELNGEPHTIADDARLSALVQRLKLRKGRIAIEINRAVIAKSEWESRLLHPGDRVEIVNFVGGG